MNTKTLVPKSLGEAEFDNQYSDAAQYGRIQFWDARYAAQSEPFEWYYGYETFRICFQEHIPLDCCGTSNMPEDMVIDGYTDVTAGDLSRVAINQQRIRCGNIPLKFFQGTMCDTNLPEKSFGAVIDKALFDSLLCTQSGETTIAQYVLEVERLLNDDGVFIVISHGNPEQRLHYLEQYDIDEPYYTPWYIQVQAVMKPREMEEEELDGDDPDSMYFIYICIKDKQLVEKKKKKETRLIKKAKKQIKTIKINL